MIKGMHGLFFTPEADAARDFLEEKLGLPFVDGGDGWLIFTAPAARAAVHPSAHVRHEISFWCDDIESTVAALRDRGVVFKSPIEEEPWGRVIAMEMPGGVDIQIFEPKHPQPGA